ALLSTLFPYTTLFRSEFGGCEIAMLAGAALAAASRGLLVLVDGFTVTVAVALAAQLDRHVLDYCVFAHCSAEHAHRALLAHLRRSEEHTSELQSRFDL